jgi:transposase
MRSLQLISHLSNDNLQTRLVESRGTIDHNRWQILYLIQIGKQHSAEVIAPLVNLSVHSVYKIVERYNHNGPSSIVCKPKGGRRRSLLSTAEEEALIVSFEKFAIKGQLKTANDMRSIVEQKVGKPVSDDYLWDLLHRHGWKKKMPRPHHPKRTQSEQDEFKKNSPKNWTPSS